MCYPKPGPRCASHSRAAFFRTKDDLERAALLLRDATDSVYADPEDVAHYEERVEKCRAAHDAALRDYETTPEGQAMLQDAADRVRESNPDAAAAIERRIEEATQARLQQQADLEESIVYCERIDAMGDVDRATVDALKTDLEYVTSGATADSIYAEHLQERAGEAIEELKDAEDVAAEAATTVIQSQATYTEVLGSGDADAVSAAEHDLIRAEQALALAQQQERDCAVRASELHTMATEASCVAQFSSDNSGREKQRVARAIAAVGAGHSAQVRDLYPNQSYTPSLIYRNPDGLLNVGVYEPSVSGFDHGRIRQVADVDYPDTGGLTVVFADGSSQHHPSDPDADHGLVLLMPEAGAEARFPEDGAVGTATEPSAA